MRIGQREMRQCLRYAFMSVCLFSGNNAVAEQADRTKPVEIEADVASLDPIKGTKTLEGNAILTQGTMRLTAERIVIREDESGNTTAQIFGGPNGQVAFRQKREGTADFMEGSADRAEFDDQADTIKLLSRARLKSGGDELKGEYIYYNSATEVMEARKSIPDAKGVALPGSNPGRVKIIMQPKISDEKPKPSAPAKN